MRHANVTAAELRSIIDKINIFKFEDIASTKIVRAEYTNILDRSVNAFYAETEDELASCMEDISDSYSVIKAFESDPLAKAITSTDLLEVTSDIVCDRFSQSVIDYCDTARAISIAARC